MELKINSGFGRFPVKDPIRKTETVELQETPEIQEETKFPLPYPQFLLGLAIGAILMGSFANYWHSKNYGEMIATFESIQRDKETLVANTEIVKGLVQKNDQIADRVDESVGKLTSKIEELKMKRSQIVPK